jgi:hypothetical protein
MMTAGAGKGAQSSTIASTNCSGAILFPFGCFGLFLFQSIYAEHFRRESLLPYHFLLQKDHTNSTGLGYLFFVIFTLLSSNKRPKNVPEGKFLGAKTTAASINFNRPITLNT